MPLRSDDVIILLGAGCSRKAGIKTSDMMIVNVHDFLKEGEKWHKYHALYCAIRGLILHSDSLQGKFNENFNIERLVISLNEIEKRKENYLNPFIGTVHPDLEQSSGTDFNLVREFKEDIVKQLREWVHISDYRTADYYTHFFDFQSEYTHALRIFTLNYDLCLEKNCPVDKNLERGFDKTTREWQADRFKENENQSQTSVYYYKMHGSIDWKRDKERGNIVREVENMPEDPDIIFGTINKLYPNDPYLFYAYEFRHYSLLAKIILVIGYSFADDHINKILKQALEHDSNRRIIVVMPNPDIDDLCRRIVGHLNHKLKR
jgi:hypothetical protein